MQGYCIQLNKRWGYDIQIDKDMGLLQTVRQGGGVITDRQGGREAGFTGSGRKV